MDTLTPNDRRDNGHGRETERQTASQTDRQTVRHMAQSTDRQTDGPANRQSDRKKDKQTLYSVVLDGHASW